MKIFVITKKMLIIAAAVIFVVAAAVIIALSFSDGAVSPTSAMAQLEEYELMFSILLCYAEGAAPLLQVCLMPFNRAIYLWVMLK